MTDREQRAREWAKAYAEGMYHKDPANILLGQHDAEKGYLAGYAEGRRDERERIAGEITFAAEKTNLGLWYVRLDFIKDIIEGKQ